MAKAQKRIHQLAKELGVDSKEIIAKCHAEGISESEIKTHQSQVKLGLEMTIREWFSSGPTATAIEEAAPVDLEKARKPRRRRAKAKPVGGDEHHEDEGGDTATAVAENDGESATHEETAEAGHEVHDGGDVKPVETTVKAEPGAVKPEVVVVGPQIQGPMPEGEIAALPAIAGTQAAAASTYAARHAHAKPKPKTTGETPPRPMITPAGRPNVPDRPTDVRPAGRLLTNPTAAKLSGPKVIRVEKADIIEPRRPRGPRPGGGGPSGVVGGGTAGPGGITRSTGPKRGRGAGGGTGGGEEEADRHGANKRRSLTSRRGRSAQALPTGPTKFTDADLQELDARLRGAQGFLKQRRRDLRKHEGGGQAQSAAVTGGKVEVAEPVTIKSFSAATGIKSVEVIKYLFKKGVMATINSTLGNGMAEEIALDYNIELVVRAQQTAEAAMLQQFENREAIDVRRRPPVATIMGHVDHGKTSLLDRIRKADVAVHEAGGITQHVGAYRVTIKGGDDSDKTVVFLDTPGHEAFTSMRSRGARLTDIVVLVVAADDGVMPQTIESINHAKAAGVALLVALNKVDKAEATEANIRKIYGQLAEHGLNPTEWGGNTEVVKVSAETGQGVKELLEMLDYQAELLELSADYGGPAKGIVIEALMAPGRGSVARVLVQSGTLKVGDWIVMGRAYGRVRDMTDDHDKSIMEAGPATPVELSGLDTLPDAGDKFYVADSLDQAEQIGTTFREAERLRQLATQTKVTLDNFTSKLGAGLKELRIVLKADVQGSLDVLTHTLEDMGNEEVGVKVIHTAVGGVTESDVLLADASDALIIAFNVVAPAMVRDLSEQRQVEIRNYRVIYDITDDVKKGLEGLLEPEKREEILGQAEVREVFKVSKVGNVAGSFVTEGKADRSARVRVTRQNVVVTDNRQIESLRRVKEDAKEVRAGMECGVKITNFDDLKSGDILIFYNTIIVKRKLA